MSESNALDAAFIFSRGRPHYARDAYQMLREAAPEVPIFLLGTEASDYPNAVDGLKTLQQCAVKLKDRYLTLSTCQTKIGRQFLEYSDLPVKRMAALWHAADQGWEHVLLMDDDIREVSSSTLAALSTALPAYSVVGAFSDDYLDTSVVSHADIERGGNHSAFLSGNFIAAAVSRARLFFPPIYNEDWLALLRCATDGHAAEIGAVKHLTYDPFSTPEIACFQEPGEVFVDTIFAHALSLRCRSLCFAASDHKQLFGSLAFWEEAISVRRQWLSELASQLDHNSTARRSVLESSRTLEKCEPADFSEFYLAWVSDAAALESTR